MLKSLSSTIHAGDMVMTKTGVCQVKTIFVDGYMWMQGAQGVFLHDGKDIVKLRWKSFVNNICNGI